MDLDSSVGPRKHRKRKRAGEDENGDRATSAQVDGAVGQDTPSPSSPAGEDPSPKGNKSTEKGQDQDEEDDKDVVKKPRLAPPTMIDPRSLPPDYPIPVQPQAEGDLAKEHALIRSDLDQTFPLWPGPLEIIPGDEVMGFVRGGGWWGDERGGGNPGWQGRAKEIIKILKEYVQSSGRVPMQSIERMEERAAVAYLSFAHSLSLRLIEDRVRKKQFESMREFDRDMMKLFEKARRWWLNGMGGGNEREYGDVLILQRLYQALTSSNELDALKSTPHPSPVYFTSPLVPSGPGNCRPVGESGKPNYEENQFTGFRVGVKDRNTIAEARYKGMTYRLGDFVHAMNPDDPARPILGQVFRAYQPTGKGASTSHHITLCWYYRPENTCHGPETMFYVDETFKTGHFVDHPVEDIIERVGCQFYTRYTRVRPVEPEWYPGWPLYVCNSRYKEDVKNYAKIKNWGACIPEELRKTRFGQGTSFNKAPHTLTMIASPFLLNRNLSGKGITGGLFAPGSRSAEQEGDEETEEPPAPILAPVPPSPGGSAPLQKKERKRDRDRRLAKLEREASAAQGSPGPSLTAVGSRGLFDTPPPEVTGFPGFPGTSTPGAPSGLQAAVKSTSTNPGQQPFPHQASPLLPVFPYTNQTPQARPPPFGIPMPLARPLDPLAPPSHPVSVNGTGLPTMRGPQVPPGMPPQRPPGPPPPAPAPVEEKIGGTTFASWIRGGEEALRRDWEVEELPQSTVDMLETNAKGDKILWFSGPPIDIPPVEQPKHSAAYLTYLAKARKALGL